MKKLWPGARATEKYKRIVASIQEVGIIEPLVVYPHAGSSGQYILLDGVVRLDILKELGEESVECIVALDDEAYTYNHKVSQLSAIQEHFMIMEAIRRGASEDRIAKALNVDVASIRRKRDLLEGICPEAVALLKEKRACAGAFRELRKVKPMRQIEIAELMVAANCFSTQVCQLPVPRNAARPVGRARQTERPSRLEPRRCLPHGTGNGFTRPRPPSY